MNDERSETNPSSLGGADASHRVARRRTVAAIALVLAWGLLATACASQAPGTGPQAAGTAAGPAAQAPSAAAKASGTQAQASENDEKVPTTSPLGSLGKIISGPNRSWMVDDRGRKYYLVEVKREPYYHITPNGDVMLPPGAAYKLEKKTPDTLVVRIYKREFTADQAARPKISEAEKLLADLDDLKVGSVDRLRLVRTGAGLPNRGQWRQGFRLVDIDRDGHLDIVHGPLRKGDGQPKIFLGDGKGGWRLWRQATFDGPPLDYGDVAVADFDGDGELDIAFAVHLRGLVVMLGDGQGHFRQWGKPGEEGSLPYWNPGSHKPIPPFSSRVVEAVDWNHDGRPDLLTVGEGPRLVRNPGSSSPNFSTGDRGPILFLNEGEGRWKRYDQGTGRDRLFGDGLAVGDFDGDGLTDFAIASRVAGAGNIVKMGKADGGWEDVSLGALTRPGIYTAVAAADLDGDGRDELLLGYSASSGKTWWTGVDLLDLEDGSWHRRAVAAEKARTGVTALAVGDLDGDGNKDLVALTGSGDRWVLLGTGDKSFVREESPELAPSQPGCQGYGAGVASLDDGRNVVVMGFAGEPGSEQLFPDLAKKCLSRGSLEAWTPQR